MYGLWCTVQYTASFVCCSTFLYGCTFNFNLFSMRLFKWIPIKYKLDLFAALWSCFYHLEWCSSFVYNKGLRLLKHWILPQFITSFCSGEIGSRILVHCLCSTGSTFSSRVSKFSYSHMVHVEELVRKVS